MIDAAEFKGHIVRLDHTAHAVRSIEAAAKLYRDVLGGVRVYGRSIDDEGFRFEQFQYPNGAKIELLAPLRQDNFVASFLRSRGEGLHHLTFMVVGLEELVAELKRGGYRIVGENYRNPAWREAFISPRSAHGTIVQLAESLGGQGVEATEAVTNFPSGESM